MAVRADDPTLADAAHEWKSAYIHIPFCRRRCPYCDFAIVDESSTAVDHERYVHAVLTEIAMADDFAVLDAVNLGGGTPSLLTADQVARIIAALGERFGLDSDVEISMELNPEDWTTGFGEGLAEAGVTRVSIGTQSMDPSVLGVLGRVHQPHRVAEVVTEARPLFGSLSIDLIFGHAAESAASWEATVAAALALDVDHISTYALTVEPGTRLAAAVRDGAPEPDPDTQADRYERFLELSETAGFDRYEVSNHARPGKVCRYNLSTWAHGEYAAFGMAAHGHRWGTRTRNHRRIDRYLEEVEAGRRPILGSEALDACAQERDRLMLGLRLAAGTPMSRVATAFVASEAGRALLTAGVMEVRSGRLIVTRPLLSDAVAREALSVPVSDC